MLNNKVNKLKYATSNDLALNNVLPAKQYIPEWYKKIKGVHYGNYSFNTESNIVDKNVKSCYPYLDSLMAGYTIELWCDIEVKISDEKGRHYLRWGQGSPEPVGVRTLDEKNIPIPFGCEPSQYNWRIPYTFKTPKGYSFLATHPLNRFDLPFLTLSGIVDADQTIGRGNYPFFLNKDFEGIIKRGTPIVQIIPFKIENWEIEKDESINDEGQKNWLAAKNTFLGYYKKNMWQKKSYE